jgi:hypothetical protein
MHLKVLSGELQEVQEAEWAPSWHTLYRRSTKLNAASVLRLRAFLLLKKRNKSNNLKSEQNVFTITEAKGYEGVRRIFWKSDLNSNLLLETQNSTFHASRLFGKILMKTSTSCSYGLSWYMKRTDKLKWP